MAWHGLEGRLNAHNLQTLGNKETQILIYTNIKGKLKQTNNERIKDLPWRCSLKLNN